MSEESRGGTDLLSVLSRASSSGGSASTRTVLVAFAANVLVGVAKTIAAVVTGSAPAIRFAVPSLASWLNTGSGTASVGPSTSPERPMPATYADFEKYWDRMMDEILVPHQTAKYGVGYVTKGFPRPKNVSPLVWRLVSPLFNPVAAFITTGGMPPRARDMLGLPWSDRKERGYQAFAALWRSRPVNWVWDRLPMRVRYNGYAVTGYGHS